MRIGMSGKAMKAWLACLLLGSGAYGVGVHAAEISYGANVGVGRSDNITRVADGEIEEDIATAGVNFSLVHTSRVLNADLAGDFAYFDYLDNAYDSELLGSFAGELRFSFVPERFDWLLADNFGQVRRSSAAITPENRENINFLTTGPDLTLALGSAARLQLSGRYSLVTYEDSPFDNDRVQGTVGVVRNLSSTSAVSVNVMAEQTRYDETSSADYDRQEAYFRFETAGARTELGFDVGYTVIDNALDESSDGVLVRLDLVRRISPSATLTLGLGQQYSDAGDIFRQLQADSGIGLITQAVQISNQPFESRFGTLGWDFTRNRTGFGIGVSHYDENYEQQPGLDRDRTVIDARFRRDLSRSLTLRFLGMFSREEFASGTTADFDEWRGEANLDWRLGRLLWLNLQYQHFDRSSDIAADGYTENMVWLRLGIGAISSGSNLSLPTR